MTAERAPLRSLILPGVLVAILFAGLVSLGNWQIRRLAWKEDLIAAATERPKLPPVEVPPAAAWPTMDVAGEEYRPFRLTGEFLPGSEALVFTNLSDPRGAFGGPGYWVVTPVRLTGGGVVLVNRGFVPQERSAAHDRQPPPAGEVTVTGLLRPDDRPNLFTPDDRPEDNIFFARHVEAIAAAKAIPPPVAPFTVDLLAEASESGTLPQAGETRFAFTNSHLAYAVTWYGLAAALLLVFGAFAWGRLRHRDPRTLDEAGPGF